MTSALQQLKKAATSWTQCRECGRQCAGPIGLHRHVREAHGMSAWAYYQKHPQALLLRALESSVVTDGEMVSAAGPCWIHQGVPARWGARMRITGAPTHVAYRLTYWSAYGTFPGGYACHVCDEPRCVNPLHIWDGSPKDNATDRDQKGRAGARRRIIGPEQADRMRHQHLSGASYRVLGAKFGCSPETARRAVLQAVEDARAKEAAEVAAAIEEFDGGEILW